jgi:hypothetical protein
MKDLKNLLFSHHEVRGEKIIFTFKEENFNSLKTFSDKFAKFLRMKDSHLISFLIKDNDYSEHPKVFWTIIKEVINVPSTQLKFENWKFSKDIEKTENFEMREDKERMLYDFGMVNCNLTDKDSGWIIDLSSHIKGLNMLDLSKNSFKDPGEIISRLPHLFNITFFNNKDKGAFEESN